MFFKSNKIQIMKLKNNQYINNEQYLRTGYTELILPEIIIPFRPFQDQPIYAFRRCWKMTAILLFLKQVALFGAFIKSGMNGAYNMVFLKFVQRQAR